MASGGYYQGATAAYNQQQPYSDYQTEYGQYQGYGSDERRVTHGYGGLSQQNPYADEHDHTPVPTMPQAYAQSARPQDPYVQAPQHTPGGYGRDAYGGMPNRHQDYAASYGLAGGQYHTGPPPQQPHPQQMTKQEQQSSWDHPFPIFPSDQDAYQEKGSIRPSIDVPRPQATGEGRVSPVQRGSQPAYAPYKQEYANQHSKEPNFAAKPARIDTSFAVELPTPSNDYYGENTTQNVGFDFSQNAQNQSSLPTQPEFSLPVRSATVPNHGHDYDRPQIDTSQYPQSPRSIGPGSQHGATVSPQSPPTDRGYWGDYEPGNIPKEATPKFAPPPPGHAFRPLPPANDGYGGYAAGDNWNDVPNYGPRPPRGRGGFRPPARTRTEPPGWDGRGYDPRSREAPARGRGSPAAFSPGYRGGRGAHPPPRRADTYDSYGAELGRHGNSSGHGRGPPRSGSTRDDWHDRNAQLHGSNRGPPPTRSSPYDGRRPDLRNAPAQNRSRGPPGLDSSLSPPAVDGRPSTATGSERVQQDRNGLQSPPIKHQRTNSDSLPHHPTPQSHQNQRPGHQNDRPPPVRQYSPPKTDSSKPGKPAPVTQQELTRVRQEAERNPNDLDAQFSLAKKLSEAAYMLVSTGDPKLGARQKQDFNAESLKILKQIINKHHVDATFFLADCYSSGKLDMPNEPREAFALYQQAAKLGHPEAAYRTAVCCEIGPEEGGGTRKDTEKAVQWYKHAANVGSVGAMFKLGMIQLRGLLGTEKDYRSAISWLQRASENADDEHPHACYELAVLYENPPSPALLQKNEEFALSLYLKAAKLGYRAAQFKVGHSYEYGQLGCQIDARNSIIWYTKAAAQGEHQSELALSGWYLTGSQGILEQSDTEAYLWARKAANASMADPALLGKAMYAMGYFTEVGIGCPRSLDEAKKWYNKSASQGFPKARERLEELRKQGERAPQRGRERLSRNNPKQHEQDCVVM